MTNQKAAPVRSKPKAKPVDPEGPRLYKVLKDGQSFHGSTLAWSLPARGKPGNWHSVDGPLQLCRHGIHVTSDPVAWYAAGATVYLVETDGDQTEFEGDKVAVREARLIRHLDESELAEVGIFISGEHDYRQPKAAWASGSATVTASGSATVTACDSATVTASGSATVTACDSATVTACDSATVTACDSATVTACDSATVTASGSATVTACDSATVQTYYGSPSVQLAHYAVLIDRRSGKPDIKTADADATAKV